MTLQILFGELILLEDSKHTTLKDQRLNAKAQSIKERRRGKVGAQRCCAVYISLCAFSFLLAPLR
jgi:hypothetical protein